MKRPAIAAAAVFFCLISTSAQTLDELKNDGKNTDNVLTYGMGYRCIATARSSRSTRPT